MNNMGGNQFNNWAPGQGGVPSGNSNGQGGKALAVLLVSISVVVVLLVGVLLWAMFMPEGKNLQSSTPCGEGGEQPEHRWLAATCTAPSRCDYCGTEKGEPLGHAWSSATCDSPESCTVCGEKRGRALSHSWLKATCSTPSQCEYCGETKGRTLSHVWRAATCIEAKYCELCGETAGTASGHSWRAATYTSPKICSKCGATYGAPLQQTTPGYNDAPVVDTDLPWSSAEIESMVGEIREEYNKIVPKIRSNSYRKVTLRTGVVAHYDSAGQLAAVIVSRGTSGIGSDSNTYSRSYYFENGQLIFAFYEGKSDSHRLYFTSGEQLIRWRYTGPDKKAVNQDYTFTQEYMKWESTAQEEVATFR